MDGGRGRHRRRRRELLAVDQPFPNHNGGNIRLGPDGLLYFGLGDGGAAGDPDDRAQDPDDLLGKILRIDPPARRRPAVRHPGRQPVRRAAAGGREIYLYGRAQPVAVLVRPRAPATCGSATSGQNAVEEIDFLPRRRRRRAPTSAGAARGHPGRHRGPRSPSPACRRSSSTTHDDGGCSVTGGFVYRGDGDPRPGRRLPVRRLLRRAARGPSAWTTAGRSTERDARGARSAQLVSIDEDADGELYVLSLSGPVYRLEQG